MAKGTLDYMFKQRVDGDDDSLSLSLYGEWNCDLDQPVMEATNHKSCDLQGTVASLKMILIPHNPAQCRWLLLFWGS